MATNEEKLEQIEQEMRQLLDFGRKGRLTSFGEGQDSVASRVLYVITDGKEG